MLDRKKHRQEVESLKADNRMKDMELGKAYVDELSELFLLRASAISEQAQMALGLASVSQQHRPAAAGGTVDFPLRAVELNLRQLKGLRFWIL